MIRTLIKIGCIGLASNAFYAQLGNAQDIELVDPAHIAQALDLNAAVDTNIDELISLKAVASDEGEVLENDGPTVRILTEMKVRNTTLGEYLNESAIAIIDTNVDRLFELNTLECEIVNNLKVANETARVAAEMPHVEGITPDAAQFDSIDENLGQIVELLGC